MSKKYDVKPEHHRLWIQNDDSNLISTNIENGFSDEFIINDDRSRIIYLAAQINSNLPINLSSKERKSILENSLEESLPDIDYLEFTVDPDSTWLIPRLKDLSHPSYRYVKTIKNSLLKNNVIITSNFPPKEFISYLSGFHDLDDILIDSFGFYCIEEDENYLLFNKNTEEKIKLDSSLHKSEFIPTHPQSIDLMITNRCGNSCLFCCRDCTPDGKVAPLENVKKCISAFQRMNVSEILIGGGDVYSYPEFDGLIEYLRIQKDKGDLVFNTALPMHSMELREKDVYNRIKDLLSVCSYISFSTDYSRGVREFIEKYKRLFDTMNVGYDIGIIPEILFDNKEDLIDTLMICRYFGITVTLLGYKYAGRGSKDTISIRKVNNARNNRKELLEILFGGHRPPYLFDSTFIETFPEVKNFVINWNMHMYEKPNSCTVDVVYNCMSKLLYTGKRIPLDMGKDIKIQVENLYKEL